jgi:DNA repair exonuclease SbcCD ATPase subunit
MSAAEETHDPEGRTPTPAPGARAGSVARDQLAVLEALGEALREAVAVLGDQALHSPAAAFRAIAAADRALAGAPELLRALTPLLELGEPGDYVTAELTKNQSLLAEISRQTAPYKDQLDTLLDSENRLQDAAAERDAVLERIEDLRRIEQLAAADADLRAQRDALETRADQVARAVADADVGLVLAGRELITLTGDLLEVVEEEIKQTLRRAADQDRLLQARLAERQATLRRIAEDTARVEEQLAAAEDEAAAAESEFEQTRTTTSARLAALSRYAAANRAVSAALAAASAESGLAGDGAAAVTADLNEAERRLAAADAAMADVLAEHQRLRQAAQAPLRLKMPASPAPPEEK